MTGCRDSIRGEFLDALMGSRIPALRRDYRDMEEMIFGEPPNFGLLLEKLASLEAELNDSVR
jgi:hypothetical protein